MAAALAVGSSSGGCAFLDETPAASNAGHQVRDRPDDHDLAGLIPQGVQTVIDVDMAQLRRSPWVTPALEARDQRVRAAKAEALGYDDVADVDHVIYAVTAAGAAAPTLVIGQGRFDGARIQEAFRARWPGAKQEQQRGITMMISGENAMALLTVRTFVSGAPPMVRSVIDRAFGVGWDVAADPLLGPTRRALCPEGDAPRPALLAVVAMDDKLRARIGDAASVPPQLHQVGVRLDLGGGLEGKALGILDDRASAQTLARRLDRLLSDTMTRLTLRAMGLGMLLAGTTVVVDGARVLVRLSVAEEHRSALSALLKTVVASSSASSGAGSFGSW
ncbi:MAG: hypothetical protein ABI560_09585 [Myxococcales bacterium]